MQPLDPEGSKSASGAGWFAGTGPTRLQRLAKNHLRSQKYARRPDGLVVDLETRVKTVTLFSTVLRPRFRLAMTGHARGALQDRPKRPRGGRSESPGVHCA